MIYIVNTNGDLKVGLLLAFSLQLNDDDGSRLFQECFVKA